MKSIYGLVATIALFSWAGESAAAADTATASSEDQVTLTEIVVIAQKRTENLQNVPIAISTVSGNACIQLKGAIYKELTDISAYSALYLARRQDDPNTHLRALCDRLTSDLPPQRPRKMRPRK